MLPRSPWKAFALAGLVAGTLDISDAFVFNYLRSHVLPERILLYIASKILGPDAYKGGWPVALLGLVMHFCIAFAWAGLFILAARRITVLTRYAVASGLLYGLIVFAVMNYVVLPFTLLYKPLPAIPSVFINAVAALVFCIGLPIALINKRFA